MSRSQNMNEGAFSDAIWLTGFCVVAVGLHIFVGTTIYCANSIWSWTQSPLINPDNVMEVSMVVLPKSTTKMVQRTTRKRVAQGDIKSTQKVPTPPRNSDLKIHTPEAKSSQGAPDRSADLKRLVDMAKVLSQVDGPDSNQDSTASDPDSNVDTQINVGSIGAQANPELAKYIQTIRDLFHKNFSPLPTIVAANPKIECTIQVRIDLNTGRVLSVKTYKTSGNASYDGAAMRAVEAVSTVPLPPERFKTHFSDGYLMVFP